MKYLTELFSNGELWIKYDVVCTFLAVHAISLQIKWHLTLLLFVFRTHPFARKLRSTGTENGIVTPQASAEKPRAQIPRITNVKPVVSQSTTPQTTRVLRSHTFTKTTTSVQRYGEI